jgi:hypothetical protein
MNPKPFCVLVTAVQLLAAVTLHAQTPALSPVMPVDPPNGAGSTQQDWVTFGWQSFVAANWPSMAPAAGSSISGQPNTALPIGASANSALIPTTWLTWRTAPGTFLPNGANPGAWAQSFQKLPRRAASLPPGLPVAPGFSPMVLNMTSKLFDDIDEASAGPLIDQAGWYVLYDIRLNQSEYTYIQQYGYYDAVNQQQAFAPNGHFYGFPRNGQDSVKPGTPVGPQFPAMFNPPLPSWAQFGATEVKASWRVLDPAKDQVSRYYTQPGYFVQPDGAVEGPVTFGLIGLHILRLTPSSPSTWFWATFEQVDNVSVPAGAPFQPTLAAPNTPNGNCADPKYNVMPAPIPAGKNIPWSNTNTPVDVCRVTPIDQSLQAVNATWQQSLAGTVWANYQMIGVINPAVPKQLNPVPIPVSGALANTGILANATLETYFQPPHGTSCMECHAFGFPQGAPQTGDFQVFSFLLGNAASSNANAAKRQGLPKQVLEKFRAAAGKK